MELTKNQLDGLTMSVKHVSKKYKYLTGFVMAKDNQLYEYTFFIDLIVDVEKFSQYYNIPKEKLSKRAFGKFETSSLASLIETKYISLGEDKDEFDKLWSEYNKEKNDIEYRLNSIYEKLPENMTINNPSESPKKISVSSFVPPI